MVMKQRLMRRKLLVKVVLMLWLSVLQDDTYPELVPPLAKELKETMPM